MLDEATLDKLREVLGQATLGEQVLRTAACSVQTRSSLGCDGLLGVTPTRVLFVAHDGLHGTQVTTWSRQNLADAVLRTDLFGPKLTLRTDDGDEITATGFADEGDGPALVTLLDRALDDVPLTMEPQPAVRAFPTEASASDVGAPESARVTRIRAILVLAGAVAVLMVGMMAAVVIYLLA